MAQPPNYSYPGAPVGGDYYPPAAAYPPQPGYPPNPAYAPPGYPPQSSAYPPPASGYPPQPGAASYPPAAGYPPQPGAAYPPQPGVSSYPPQPGYPPQATPYPPQPTPGYPPQATPGYPPQPTPGYPPQATSGYPPQATPGYPPQPTPGYPPQTAAAYPPQPAAGYGYAPQATTTYPAQTAYPPQAGYAAAAAVPAPQFPQAPIVAQSVYPSAAVQVAAVPAASSYMMPRTDAGTVFPAPNFNVETDCETLRHAMKGLGTDEKAIIEVLTHRCNAQRQEILKKYKTMYGKDLIKELRSELTGNFEHTIVSLMLTPPEFRAKEMRDAMKGAGTDEVGLIQVLCTSSNQMIRDTRDAYKRMYDRNLEKDIEKETSGHFKRLLIACANGSRNETPQVDMNKAQTLAEQLYRAGSAKMGTDETGFLRVLANESFPQLQATFDVYRQKYGKSIEDVLKSEMSGDLLRGMLAIVRCVTNPPGYFAKALYDSMSGAGTRDHELVRMVVMRCEVDMQLIKQEFQRTYGKTLASMIASDTSGDYKKVLVALVGP